MQAVCISDCASSAHSQQVLRRKGKHLHAETTMMEADLDVFCSRRMERM